MDDRIRVTGCFALLIGRRSLPSSRPVITTGRAETPVAASLQFVRSTLCGVNEERRKSRKLDHCWTTASLLRSAVAFCFACDACTTRRNVNYSGMSCYCVLQNYAAASLLVASTSSYAGAAHILARVLLPLLLLAVAVELTYAMYYNCNSFCRENLAQPMTSDPRQLGRAGGSWTVVVVQSQDRRQASMFVCKA